MSAIDRTTGLHRAPSVPRRDFMRHLGFGAAGLGLMGSSSLVAALPPPDSSLLSSRSEDDDVNPAACSVALWSTSRRAATQQVSVTSCTPCNCNPQNQINFVIKQQMVTNFDVLGFCDELGHIGFPTAARMEWTIPKKEVRIVGPCQSLIGSFAGKFKVTDTAGNALIAGKFSGTLGYDPCDETSPCCAFPRVVGMLTGKGVNGTRFADCLVRWAFCGVEEAVQTNPCNIIRWDVRINGITKCPCV